MNRSVPSAIGTSTPAQAIRVAFRPDFFSSFRLVPRPASNISMITPISAIFDRKSDSCTKPNTAPPIRRPARISPTTSGMPIFFPAVENTFAANSRIARSSR